MGMDTPSMHASIHTSIKSPIWRQTPDLLRTIDLPCAGFVKSSWMGGWTRLLLLRTAHYGYGSMACTETSGVNWFNKIFALLQDAWWFQAEIRHHVFPAVIFAIQPMCVCIPVNYLQSWHSIKAISNKKLVIPSFQCSPKAQLWRHPSYAFPWGIELGWRNRASTFTSPYFDTQISEEVTLHLFLRKPSSSKPFRGEGGSHCGPICYLRSK